jgi:hypothetical protein
MQPSQSRFELCMASIIKKRYDKKMTVVYLNNISLWRHTVTTRHTYFVSIAPAVCLSAQPTSSISDADVQQKSYTNPKVIEVLHECGLFTPRNFASPRSGWS